MTAERLGHPLDSLTCPWRVARTSADTPPQVKSLRLGAGERDRTADLPFTRRPLCQLSYTGGDFEHGSRAGP
jgi:hypothetical protein